MEKDVFKRILKEKIILIVRGVSREQLLPFCQAVYDGGIRLLELTYTAGMPETDEQNRDNIRFVREHFGDRMTIGAGTVLTPRQVELTKEAGGQFIISPNTDEAVIRATKALGLISISGAMTPTEIVYAHHCGADFIKLFPAAALGIEYFKAVTTPLSHIPILAVAGVNTQNMGEFMKAGACGFGVSSAIANPMLLKNRDYEAIRMAAQEYVQAVLEQDISTKQV